MVEQEKLSRVRSTFRVSYLLIILICVSFSRANRARGEAIAPEYGEHERPLERSDRTVLALGLVTVVIYQTGIRIIPIERLTDVDRKWL